MKTGPRFAPAVIAALLALVSPSALRAADGGPATATATEARRLYGEYERTRASRTLRLAIERAAAAVDLEPRNAALWSLLGSLTTAAVGEHPELAATAEETLRTALELEPRDAGARALLGHLLVSRRRYDAALECFEQAVAGEPRLLNSPVVAAMASAYAIDSQRRRGIAFLEKAASAHPEADSARLALAILLHESPRRQDALREARHVAERPGANPADREYARRLIAQWEARRD